jgi:DNA polymerase-4
MSYLHALTPQVEQISIDEAFLDVSDVPGDIETCAQKLGNQVRDELKLPCSLGGATNKLVAKIATDVGKAAAKGSGPPNAITIVPPGSEAAFLAPLPVRMLWGVGEKTAARLEKIAIHTIGELAEHSELELIKTFGKNGWEISQRAQGIDRRGIVTSRLAKSISQERTFPQDVYSEKMLNDTLKSQAKRVAKRLQRQNMRGKTVKIKLRWPDFTTLTRQTTLNQPTDEVDEIYKAARKLLKSEWVPGQGVRLVGVGISGLDKTRQLGLWDKDLRKERQLQAAIDTLEAKFGTGVLWRGHLDNPGERRH